MPNFLLTFRTETIEEIGGKRVRREAYNFERIISAPSYDIALKIAKAMLGEEVYYIPVYLCEVLSVKKTRRKPFGISVLCDDYTWDRVLSKLLFYLWEELYGKPTFDGFKYFPANGFGVRQGMRESMKGVMVKVGLRLNRAQRERLRSINL